MLNRQSRTLFISGIVLMVYNLMPCVSCTLCLCSLMTAFFYLPRKYYQYLSRAMIGAGLVISFWVSSALVDYTKGEAKLKSMGQLVLITHNASYAERTLSYESPDMVWMPTKAIRHYIHNQTTKNLVNSFGYRDKLKNLKPKQMSSPTCGGPTSVPINCW